MSKRIDPFSQKRRSAPEHTRTFTDEACPGDELTVTIRRVDTAVQYGVIDVSGDLEIEYIIGNKETKEAPIPIEVDGEAIPLSTLLIRQCLSLQEMQTAPPNERYGWKEFAALSVTMPDAFNALVSWSNTVQSGSIDAKKKDSKEGEEVSSEHASEGSGNTPST